MNPQTRHPWRATLALIPSAMRRAVLVSLGVLAASTPAVAGYNRPAVQDAFDPALLRIDESRHLGGSTPDVVVTTQTGTTRLHALTRGVPTILVLAYYSCHGPCPTTIRNLARALRGVLAPAHRVVVLSFDAADNLDTLRRATSDLASLPDHWTFGLLSREDSARLTGATGFRYFFSEPDRTFVHPSVLVFLSPEGRIMRYLYGAEPRTTDVELALIEARNRTPRVNEIIDTVRLICYRYDPERSRYVLHPTLLFGGIGFGVLGATGLIALAYKRHPKGEQ